MQTCINVKFRQQINMMLQLLGSTCGPDIEYSGQLKVHFILIMIYKGLKLKGCYVHFSSKMMTGNWSLSMHEKILDCVHEFSSNFNNNNKVIIKYKVFRSDRHKYLKVSIKYKRVKSKWTEESMRMKLLVRNRKQFMMLCFMLKKFKKQYLDKGEEK